MKTWRLVTGVALVLIVGILIGSTGTRLYLGHRYHVPMDRKARAAFLMKDLSKELGLTQEQKAAIGQILDEMAERLHQRYLQARPEVEGIVDESFSRIRTELNDDQKQKFDVLKEKYKKRRRSSDR
jgi:hypothetical protein